MSNAGACDESSAAFFISGANVFSFGPNISSLLLVFHRQMQSLNFQLPAFAGTIPSCGVTGQVRQGTTDPVTIPGSKEFVMAVMGIRQLEQRKLVCEQPTYGRRGIAIQATAQTLGNTSRSLENQLFCVPSAPACDEQPDNVDEWILRARLGVYNEERGLPVNCVHAESEDARVDCKECIEDALERMQAVATNSVALSTEEALHGRGQCTIWRTPDGKFKSETFKDYCRAELECTFAAMVVARKDYDTPIATPLFVAQDPKLYWPLIFHHGSIRAALEHVAPHVVWMTELGPVKATIQDPIPVVTSKHYDDGPKRVLRKCGNNLCLKMEPDKGLGDFLLCGRCNQRQYCSKACAAQDLSLHKRECIAPGKPEPVPKFPDAEPKKPGAEPSVDEEVVVRGLKAKPEDNGKIGRIVGGLNTEGRYPVMLGDKPIAIKPLNFLRVCVECQESAKKGRKFRCVHGLEVCNECQLDLVVVNQLWKLHFTGEALSRSTIEQVGEYHFASLEDDADGPEECTAQPDTEFPMEAHGLKSDEKKLLLKHLLAASDHSERTAVAIVGLICYGSRDELVARAYVASHGEAWA